MPTSTGTLRYSPKFSGMRTSSKWWVVIDCDPAIGRYYRNLFYLGNSKTKKLVRPAWKEHISVVRNEEPPEENKFLWEKYNGQELEFQYSSELNSDGHFFWLNVDCDFALELRDELGLSRQPIYPLHMTVGNSGENL